MSNVKITVSRNGSLKVEGNVQLVDPDGNELPTRDGLPFFLCRCGQSQNKPFCDGSHNRVGFDGSLVKST
jgi:3-phenylpropionate/trans-cinnamate dioxygenase ferredoxin subunit